MPKLPYAEIFIWVKRYEYTSRQEKQKCQVTRFFKKMSIAAGINLKLLSIYSLKCTNLSDAVLQISLVKRACGTVHCQHK